MQFVPESLLQHARRIQPDQDDLAIKKQVITIVPTFISIVNEAIFFVLFLAAGLPSIGIAFAVLALGQLFAFALGSFRPQRAGFAAILFGVVAVAVDFYIHAQAGGFTSGILAFAWLTLVPLAAYFVAGQRVGAFILLLSLLAFVTGVILDPVFARSPLPIPYTLLLFYNVVTLCFVSIIAYSWAQFLLNQAEGARATADKLLLNILPRSIALRLKSGEETIADSFDEVTVLFADIVDFTTMSADANPVDVVGKLNEVFSDFDDLAAKHGLEKIKTIGDAYMVAGGLPQPRLDHVEAVAAFAVDMLEAVGRHRSWTGEPIRLRVGINTGPIVAGVIGRQKFIYDVWGDAVNVASRMESNGLANQIQVTAAVREKLNGRYTFEERPPIQVKGKGLMVTYLMTPLPDLAAS